MIKKLLLILILSFLCFVPCIQAQWNQIVTPGLIVHGLGTIGNYLLAGTDQGTFRSSDYGVAWNKVQNSRFQSFAIMEKIFFACDGYDVFLSNDSGANWIKVGGSGNAQCIAAFNDSLYTGGYFFGTSYSADSGQSWVSADYGYHRITCLMANELGVFQGGASGISLLNIGLKKYTSVSPSDVFGITSLCRADSDLCAATIDGMFRFNSTGSEWTSINHGLKDSSVHTIISYDSKIFIASNAGVFFSSDRGTNWNSLNKGLPNDTGFRSLTIVGGYLFVGTPGADYITVGNGIWRRSLSDLANVNERPNKSDLNISLSPNPTNGIITAHNTTANIMHVTITNVLGEIVSELPHPNASEFTLDLSKLPPGTYFARFSLANEVVTRKIIKE
jgi:hypothetical protein